MVAPAVIAGGLSLLGGLFGQRSERKAIAAQNAYNDPSAVRKRFEAAGFNPLLGIQAGVGMQATTGGTNYMGAAIADAGLLFAEGLQQRQDATKAEALEQQNKTLVRKVEQMTIRPKMGGGIYSQNVTTPTLREATKPRALPMSKATTSPDDLGLPPLRETDPLDPRRLVDQKDVTSTGGFMKVDNPYFGEMWFPTIDGDEVMDILDVPSVMLAAPQLAYNKGNYMSYGGGRESRPSITRKQALADRDARNLARQRKNPAANGRNYLFDPFHRDGYLPRGLN